MQIMFLLALVILGSIAFSCSIGGWVFIRFLRGQRPILLLPSFSQWLYIGLGACGLGVVMGVAFFNIFSPKKVQISDPRIQPLLEAAGHFNRSQYGFTPIPTTANVSYESKPRDHYDAMLHINSKTSRTIAFRKERDGYREISEQEIFLGPKKFTNGDGTFNEQICLTFETEPVSGSLINQLNVTYQGEDPRLNRELKLEDVKPVLKEWGY